MFSFYGMNPSYYYGRGKFISDHFMLFYVVSSNNVMRVQNNSISSNFLTPKLLLFAVEIHAKILLSVIYKLF